MKASSLGGPKPQFVDANGNPYSGAKLFFYAAGSSTKQNTYRDSTGATPNSNPIVLDSSGRPTYEIWFTDGLTYKAVLAPSTDSDPPNSPIFTVDNLAGINDVTASVDEWQASGLTPTYVGATSFTVSGDQTATFTAGRRLKSSNTAGTIYSTVASSSYNGGTLLTTVTVVNDSGTLDSGLSSVSISILRADHSSLPHTKSSSTGLEFSAEVGIGDLNAAYRIIVRGRTSDNTKYAGAYQDSNGNVLWRLRNDGRLETGAQSNSPYNNTSGSAANMYVDSGGIVYRSTSSLKYKRDVREYDKGLAEVMALRPVYYKGKAEADGETQYAGLIAEEVYSVAPEFVGLKNGAPDDVRYQNMLALALKAIQELKADFDAYKLTHP